jgi:hypothetical protein
LKSKTALLLFFTMASAFCVQADNNAPWNIKMVALDNGETRHIKYNQLTGETWWSKNTTWEKITEPQLIPNSTYQFKVVSTGKSWRTLRIDKLTGQTWKNSRGKWVALKPANE